MFKIFVFDLGNVIVPFDHSTIAKRLIGYSKNQQLYSAEDIHKFFYKVEELEHQYEEGRISTEEFINRVIDRFELDISSEEFKSIFNDIFFEIDLRMDKLIRTIKARGYPLILLSNTNEMHFEYILRKYPLLRLFDEYILSYKEGVRKPNEMIYRALLKKAKCRPDEIFYTDDILDYVKAAQRLNISAFQFINIEELYKIITQFISI
jgi:putative hydrolase of the HAD superfamily